MIAFLILLAAALTRLVPHAIHGIGLNFTAVGAGLLFFGSRKLGRIPVAVQAVIAMTVIALTDVYLTTVVYSRPFYVSNYLVTWAWYAAVCLMGTALLRKVTVLRVAAGVLASATGFFLLSNFMVWAGSHVAYPHTFAGLATCYAAGLPFYLNDLASTTLAAGAFFGLPALAARYNRAPQPAEITTESIA